MTAPVTVSSIARHGVSLVSPVDPSFDEIARPLIGSRADRIFKSSAEQTCVVEGLDDLDESDSWIGWLRRYPAADVPRLLRAVRLEPFVITPRD